MGEIVNLNKRRKARDRAVARRTAETNRVTFGLTRAEREAAKAGRERVSSLLDGHKLEDDKDA
ncbi:MAG: DUF4169 family protein [Bordetella sp.]|nr:DUF4169 family protein [Bordetella sp.]